MDNDQDSQGKGSRSRGGGFTEQNVTPLVPDMWADNLTDELPKELTEDLVGGPRQKSQADSNLITGETFLKDAR